MKCGIPDYWNHTLPPLTSQLTISLRAVSRPLLTAWIDTPNLSLGGTVTLKGSWVRFTFGSLYST